MKLLPLFVLFIVISLSVYSADKKVKLIYTGESPVVKYGVNRLSNHLENAGITVITKQQQ